MDQYRARLRLTAYRPIHKEGVAIFLSVSSFEHCRLIQALNAFGIVPVTREGRKIFSCRIDWNEWQSI